MCQSNTLKLLFFFWFFSFRKERKKYDNKVIKVSTIWSSLCFPCFENIKQRWRIDCSRFTTLARWEFHYSYWASRNSKNEDVSSIKHLHIFEYLTALFEVNRNTSGNTLLLHWKQTAVPLEENSSGLESKPQYHWMQKRCLWKQTTVHLEANWGATGSNRGTNGSKPRY